jgi:hypothetical protein
MLSVKPHTYNKARNGPADERAYLFLYIKTPQISITQDIPTQQQIDRTFKYGVKGIAFYYGIRIRCFAPPQAEAEYH